MPDEAFTPWQRDPPAKKWLRRRGKKKSSVTPPQQKQEAVSERPPEQKPTSVAESETPPVSADSTSIETPSLAKPASRSAVAPTQLPQVQSTSRDTPSLFGRKKEDKKDELAESEDLNEIEDQNHDFSNEELIAVWQEFRDIRKHAKAGDMEMMVLNRVIEKKDQNVVIKLTNSLEGSILDRFEDDAVQYLRKKLGNNLLRIEREIQEQEAGKKLYTSKDKYEYMVSQNPALKDLKERLGLDFDY